MTQVFPICTIRLLKDTTHLRTTATVVILSTENPNTIPVVWVQWC